MDNKSYELVVSNNMQYVAGICMKNKKKEMYEMKVWYANNMREITVLFVCLDLGGERFAISNNGKYVATAQYEAHKEGNLHIYEVESGKSVFKNVSLRGIQWVMFDDCENLMVGTEGNGIFVFDFFGTCKRKIKGRKYFGANILLLNDKNVYYRENIFKASTFAYLFAEETTRGILVSEANGDMYYYNNNRQLYWKSDCLDLGHFITLYYGREKNIIFGVLCNPRKKADERMHLVVLNENSGEIISASSIETASYVFVEYSETVMLINGKGKIYTFICNQLEESFY